MDAEVRGRTLLDSARRIRYNLMRAAGQFLLIDRIGGRTDSAGKPRGASDTSIAARPRMAKLIPFIALSVAMPALLVAVGCQSNKPMVQNIPPPSFSGPTVQAGATPQPHVAQNGTPPANVAPVKPNDNTIPREWSAVSGSRPWKWIVIHHSATPSGSAKAFDRMHKEKGWDELGYHFVIGNGTETGDGQIEVGPRWPKQKWGAHAKTPDNQYNDYGIGICLVGNFDIERPTPNQLRSLAKLVAYLEKTYHIPSSRVLGHSDTKPTDCPGRNMSVAMVRRMAQQVLADSGEAIAGDVRTVSANELLSDTSDVAITP